MTTQWLMTPYAPDSNGVLDEVLNRPAWHERAACRGVDVNVFFMGVGRPNDTAASYCRRCPVKEECGEYALNRFVDGYWGGMSQNERIRIRKSRREHNGQGAAAPVLQGEERAAPGY